MKRNGTKVRFATIMALQVILHGYLSVAGAIEPDFDQHISASDLLRQAREDLGLKGEKERELPGIRPFNSPTSQIPRTSYAVDVLRAKTGSDSSINVRRGVSEPSSTVDIKQVAPGEIFPCISYPPRKTSEIPQDEYHRCSPDASCPTLEDVAKELGAASRQNRFFEELFPKVAFNENYLHARTLPEPLRLIGDEGEPFLKEFLGIQAERCELLKETKVGDCQDPALYHEAELIEQWTNTINERFSLMEQNRAAYNRACFGESRPAYCDGWFSRGQQCVDDHDAEIEIYNKTDEDWAERFQLLDQKKQDQTIKVQNWDARTITFVQSGETVLKDKVSTLRLQSQEGKDPPTTTKFLHMKGIISKTNALRLLDNLWSAMTPVERRERPNAFQCAQTYMKRAPSDGIPAFTKYPCYEGNDRTHGPRIDIEVLRGRAMADDPQ